jgi:hypothetical protein
MDVKIELSPIDAYKGKLNQYGTAFYYYFGLVPKHPSINLNVFREYFSSMLGHQIIQLQLCDGPSKLKAKLRSLLVPNFFASTHFMPDHIKTHFDVLDLEANQLVNLHPEDLKKKFSRMKENIQMYSNEFPWHILCLVAHFKLQMKGIVQELEDGKPQSFNFSNSFITNELVKLKTQAIYPKNDDVYVEYKIKNNMELQLPLSSLAIKNTEETSVLIFKHLEKDIIHLHSTPVMIHFIKFILQSANGIKISDILLNLKVPSLKDLNETTKSFEDLKEFKVALLKDSEELIAGILRTEVSR